MVDTPRAPRESTPEPTAIRVAGLRKRFGEQTVLDRVDLSVARGDLVTVLGRSGTGKSVLLKLIMGLQTPDAGSIRIDGREVVGLPIDELNEVRKRVGFLFQQAALYDSLTVEDNVAFPLRRHTALGAAERAARARDLLAQVGMDGDRDKLPAQVSGGMNKRVGLARALALDPDILLLDEPTAGLDPITAAEIVDLIRRLRQARAMAAVVVTHDLRSAEALADRVALLHEGAIVAEGPLAEVRRTDDPFVRAFVRPRFARQHV